MFSVSLISGLVGLLWLTDIVSQTPDIPIQTPDGTFLEIILQKKKHNHIDDFYPTRPPIAVSEMQTRF
jgi:hypothetical protein